MTVKISACASGWSTSSFCTRSAAASSSPRSRQSVRGRAVRDWIGAHQQSGERLAHLGRLRGLPLRAVALGREPVRIERRQAAEHEDDHGRRRHGADVSPDEPRRPIPQRVGAGADRLVTQKTAEIIGQRRDRGIALGRVLLERLGDDGVEISPKRPAQPGHCRAAPRGMASERLRRLGPADNGVRHPAGLHFDDGADQRDG